LYNKLPDSELVNLLNSGDDLAYTEIYNRYWPLLFSHASRMLRDEDEAMDVIQDVFIILWNNISDLTSILSLRAFLYTTTRNRTINIINRSKRKDQYVSSLATFMDEGELATDNQVAFNECIAQIEKGVANLPKKMREIFEMSRNLGYSHKQIAEQLNITDHAVKKSINRTLKILRTRFSIFFLSIFL
jgi:RNA polymerase sigma-70 factor (family 1)